jgi:DNA-binding response OmpR family regulator
MTVSDRIGYILCTAACLEGAELGRKVLIADDNRQIRMLVRAALRSGGYELLEAVDGEEALDMAVSEQPDVILLDVMMPKLDGFEVLDFIRKRSETECCHVVMLTTAASEADQKYGSEHGAEEYVVKPFTPSDLRAAVERVLNSEE